MFATNNRSLPARGASRFDFGLGEVDRLFDQLFKGFETSVQSAGWSAPWACWEDEGHIYLEVELPGVKNDDVELVVEHGRLHLKAQRKAPEGEREYRFNNRRYGQYERVTALPETVDTNNVTAEMRDGVLHLTLTKLPQAQPKRIAVQTG